MRISMISVVTSTFALSTPIALGAIGGLFGEKSGIVNIGLEGTISFGAFAAAVVAYYANNPWIGLVAGATMGILISLIHAVFCVSLRINQNIIGLAINILASSSTVFASSLLFNNKGYTAQITKLPSVSIPVLKNIPVVSVLFDKISLLTLFAFMFAVIGWFLLYRTRFGLHVIASGETPEAARARGINVNRVRYVAVLIGGFTCGLAGAFMSISYLNMYVMDMVSGRGFIAIAAILFGRYNPLGVYLAALFFGFADALQMSLQGNLNIPNEVIQCLPYVLTIVAVAFNEVIIEKRRLSKA